MTDKIVTEAVRLLHRYRNETPFGHQPHMIAHEADALLARYTAMTTAREPALDDDALIGRLWDLHRRAVTYASDKPCVNMLLADLGKGVRAAIDRLQAKAPETDR